MSLDYRVLGPIEVWANERQLDLGGARQRRLIAALALAGGRPVSAERLIDIVWVGEPPKQARNTLRTYIARARRVLEVDGEAPLLTDANGWRLERGEDALDSARFESQLAAARAMAADPIAALASIEEALALWRDDAFVEFGTEDWCAGEAVRLDELRFVAQEEKVEAMLGCGLYDDAIGELERFIEHHPLRDRPRGQQMVALYRAGRQVEAVRRYQDYRQYLDHEVGVEPSGELRTLEQRIINRDPSLQQLAPTGRQLRGYQLGQQIGEGGFGRIYRASQPALGREVAIKVIRPELADNPEFIRRFDGEAQIVARLEHPHIVPLFDYWREPGGAYLVMRYLRGGTAEQLLESRGSLPVGQVSRIVDEIGSALARAHAAGVVHRDVKPANILFDDQGNSYLGDFGIASDVGSPSHLEIDSHTDAVYLSPEQALQGEVAASSDVYAMGVVLFELLTGQTPFHRETPMPELIEAKRTGALPKLTDVPPDLSEALDEVIQRATAPNPNDRFHEIGDLVLAVRAATVPAGDSRPQVPLGLVGRNPYKGLASFDEADAVDFFGRDELVERLHGHANKSRFLAVVGPSGSGKSSAVRAGLAPRLRSGGDYVVSMVPGQHPMAELTRSLLQVAPASQAAATQDALGADGGLVEAAARCLPDGSAELVLIVDQFEELFTVSDETERDEFLRAIATAATDDAGRVRVVVTIRADFYDRPLSHRRISDLVQANTIAVTPLSPAELERAITGPATRVGLAVESGLVAALIADSAGAPASLPLVQYGLTQLAERRDGSAMTLAAYSRHGGLSGAISRRADDIYDGFDDVRRDDVRRLFGRLVTPGEGTEDTRRRVSSTELASISGEVITAYGDARLLTFDHDRATREPTVEVAHEALIREWPRLHRWLEADREGLRIMRHAASAAEAWIDAEHDPDELYRGGRLDTLEEWAAAKPGTLNRQEQDFLEASVTMRDAAVVEQKQRYDQQLRSNLRLRRLLTGVGLLAVISLVAGLIAFQQGRRADDEAAEAEFGRLIARARTLPAQDLPLALLAAVEAFDLKDRAESRGALQEALMAEPRFAGRTQVLGDAGPSTEGPDGAWIFTSRIVAGGSGSEGNLFNVTSEGNWFDSRTLEPLGSVAVDERWHLVSSPDRSLIAAMWLEPPWDVEGDPRLSEVRLHDATGRQVASLPTNGQPSLVRFLDEDHLIVGGDEAGITIWNLVAEEVEATIAIPGSPRLDQVDVSADGSLLVVSSPAWFSARVMLLDLELATIVAGTVGSCRDRCPVRFDPSGERVAIGEPDGVVVRDVATWAVQTQVIAPSDTAFAVDFSDDGTMLYLGTLDGDLTFYNSFTGELAGPTIDVGPDLVGDVMTVPGGEVITYSDQGILQRWGVIVHGRTGGAEGFMDRSGPFGTWVGSTDGFGIFSPDSSTFVRTNDPELGWVTVYEPATGEAVEQFDLAAGARLGIAAFSPDGERVAIARFSGEIAVYDAATFEPTGEVHPGVGFMFATFSPDGRRLAVGANRPFDQVDRFDARIWNIESGQVTPLELTVDFEAAGRPSWNPDGTQVAISDIVGGDAVFDAETGLQVGTRFSVRGQAEARDVIWEADGRHVLGVGDPGVSRWDATTGERVVPFTDITSGLWMDLADDGTLLVTASEENQARLWDLQAGVPLGAPFPDPGMGWVAFNQLPPIPALSPDGRFLALNGANGTVLWTLDPQIWRDRACELAGRNMTRNEWTNVMGDIPFRATCDQWPLD